MCFGRQGGGQVVSMLAFYSDVLSPNTQNKSSKNCKRLKILQKWQNFDISDHTAFLKWGNHGLFLFIFKKTVGFSGIRTWIVGKEGEHADHLTTTTA